MKNIAHLSDIRTLMLNLNKEERLSMTLRMYTHQKSTQIYHEILLPNNTKTSITSILVASLSICMNTPVLRLAPITLLKQYKHFPCTTVAV